MARRFVTPAQRKRRIFLDVLLLIIVLTALAFKLDFPIFTTQQAVEATQSRHLFGPGRVIAAVDCQAVPSRYSRYCILQDGNWYAWCGVNRNPGQPFWHTGQLQAVENDPDLSLVPLVVDEGLILVISNDPEITRVEVTFPARDEDDPGLCLLSIDQPQRVENCFLFSYYTSDLLAHYPEELQVTGYDAAGTVIYQSPEPESWETRYELR